MRKITKESIEAFLSRQNFTKSNMKVRNMDGKTYLKLHNNIIAVLHVDGTLMITNAGWESPTTKERLNGLPNVSIHQKNWQWYLNGEKWDGNMTEIK